jgi:hypothetical protein
MLRVLGAICLGVAVVGCNVDSLLVTHVPPPFMDASAASLEFTASVSKAEISLGDTATVTFILRNPTTETVRLDFRSTCQILPYIRNEDALVYPNGGAWGCGAALTALTLGPGEERVRSVIVIGGAPGGPGVVPLQTGAYRAYAELGDDRGRSPSVLFSVGSN